MAIQIDCEELRECPGYLKWMSDKIRGISVKDTGELKPEEVELGTVKLSTVGCAVGAICWAVAFSV